MNKLILPFSLITALISIFLLSGSFSDKSLHFFGIAGQREQTISFQYPVEIVQVFGVDGKEVEQGDLMLEVKRHELDTDRTTLDQEIKRYQLQKQETNNTINSQLASLEAKKQAVIADMDYQIHILELRLKINTNVLESISEQNQEEHSKVDSTELKDLKRKRYYLVQSIQAEIDNLSEQLNTSIRPIDAQLSELFQRKQELLQQNTSLKVNALFHGRIGSVNFKAGELVPPFQPIMSIHSRIPRYIKGYIHENILNDVKVGQLVYVRSLAFNKDLAPLDGVVESMGNRIVEYPERLKKNPLVPAWGREVVVRLNNLNHTLLFGEKVEVLLQKPIHTSLGLQVIKKANASTQNNEKTIDIKPIKSADSKINSKKIEASGILWSASNNHYLVISDESHNNKSSVFIMDKSEKITARLSRLNQDGQNMDDLESISTDGQYTYLLSSLSHNKKGKLKNKRKQFIRFKYQNQQVTEKQQIDLYQVLKKINKKQTQSTVAMFLTEAMNQHSIDIESHFVTNNTLYLGFKSPFATANKTLILKINNVSGLFKEQIPKAEIWQTILLLDSETGEPMQLSDMILVDQQLFLLSVSRSSIKSSVLWRYHLKNGTLEEIKKFPGLKAEGITYQREKSSFTLVFDEGNNAHSKILSFIFPAE